MNRMKLLDAEERAFKEFLSTDRYLECKKAFNLFDEDGTGTITIEHTADILNNMDHSVTVDQILGQLQNISAHEPYSISSVDFKQFIKLMSVFSANSVHEDEMYLVFQQFDKDGDGFISPHELKDVLSTVDEEITDADVEEMMREADRDGDGKVSYNEFVCVMTNSNGWHMMSTLPAVEEEPNETENQDDLGKKEDKCDVIAQTNDDESVPPHQSTSIERASSDNHPDQMPAAIQNENNPIRSVRTRRKSWFSNMLGRRKSTPENSGGPASFGTLPSRKSCPALAFPSQEETSIAANSAPTRRFSLSANASSMFSAMRKKTRKAR